jgi:hypothetical protein
MRKALYYIPLAITTLFIYSVVFQFPFHLMIGYGLASVFGFVIIVAIPVWIMRDAVQAGAHYPRLWAQIAFAFSLPFWVLHWLLFQDFSESRIERIIFWTATHRSIIYFFAVLLLLSGLSLLTWINHDSEIAYFVVGTALYLMIFVDIAEFLESEAIKTPGTREYW